MSASLHFFPMTVALELFHQCVQDVAKGKRAVEHSPARPEISAHAQARVPSSRHLRRLSRVAAMGVWGTSSPRFSLFVERNLILKANAYKNKNPALSEGFLFSKLSWSRGCKDLKDRRNGRRPAWHKA